MQAKFLEKAVWIGLSLLLLSIFLTGTLGYFASFLGLGIFTLGIGFLLLILKITGLAKKWHLSNPTKISSATIIGFLLLTGFSVTAAGFTVDAQGINLSAIIAPLLVGLGIWVFHTNTRIDTRTESINKRIDEINRRIDELYRRFPPGH